MKVVRIVSELDFGGVEQVALNSFPALNKRVILQVLVLNRGGKVSGLLEEIGVSIKVLDVHPRIPNLKLIRRIEREIASFRPDVVHCQGAEANFHGIWAAKRAKVPRIIGEEIGIPNHHNYWKWVFRWIYGKVDVVIAISEAVKKSIVGLGEVEAGKVSVLYNPVDSRQFAVGSRGPLKDNEPLVSNQDFVFVISCRLVPIKNLERLVKAFGLLMQKKPERSVKLKIVGDGPEKENLEFIIQNLELEGKVELLGFQSNIWPFLEEADAFVLPSLREGSSVSLAEAMTTGLPSIVTQVGGASEILGKSQAGFLVDPLDTNSIQSAMQQMVDLSPEEREAMGVRAKREAERFSVSHYIQELLKIYQSPRSPVPSL